jgi:hypothetical protein
MDGRMLKALDAVLASKGGRGVFLASFSAITHLIALASASGALRTVLLKTLFLMLGAAVLARR